MRGLKTKLRNVLYNTSIIDYDIYIFTETWLNSTIFSSELFDSNLFNVFRCDRREAFRRSGGGVLIACNASLPAQSYNLDDINEQFPQIDIVCVTLGLNLSLNIIGLYIPPDLNIQVYSDFLDVLSAHPSVDAGELVVIGDFNSPNYLAYVNDGCDCPRAEVINYFASFLNLKQFNCIVNSINRLLDLVFSTLKYVNMINTEPLLKLDPYHPALSISLQFFIDRGKNSSKMPVGKFNFHRYNKDILTDSLNNLNWDLMNNMHPDDACKIFYRLIESAFDRSLPRTAAYSSHNNIKYPMWFTWDIISDCKLKELYRLKLRKNLTSYYKAQYKALRNSLKSRIKSAYRNYQTEAEASLYREPKNFWKFISNSKRQNQFPTSFCINDESVSDPQVIADEFATYFSSVFNPFDLSVNLDKICPISDYLGGILLPDEATILKYINQLPNKMSAGADGIPCTIAKDTATCFVSPLTRLIQSCIEYRVFPSLWKHSKVCPIHKADDPTLITN